MSSGTTPGTVLLLGIPSEPPLKLVADALAAQGLPYVLWNQREVLQTRVELGLDDGQALGRLRSPGNEVYFEDVVGVYLRMTDFRTLPELAWLEDDDESLTHAAEVTDALLAWLEAAPARVVNRYESGMSNGSKPYQLQLISKEFLVPDSLVTTDPRAALDFWAAHGRVVYKSVSGQRSIVQELTSADAASLPALANCPTLFQELIAGYDVRVHTIASGEVFATAIVSPTVDYRYAGSQSGQPADYSPVELAPELEERCLRLARRLGLDFSGIDLKVTPEGEIYCLEVNPSPAYSAFESTTGQPISHALARYLAAA